MSAATDSPAHRFVAKFSEYAHKANARELHSLCEAMPWHALVSLTLEDSSFLKALNKAAVPEINLVFQIEHVERLDSLTQKIKDISP